jgi:hypothetical protein
MSAYSRSQPFSSVDIPQEEWDANAAQWRAAQARFPEVAPSPSWSAPDLDTPPGGDPSEALRDAQMPHADWQALRAQQLAERGVDQSDERHRVRTAPIDPNRTPVFQPGPDGKLHPIPGWHTTGPLAFDEWAHDIDWGGVARNLVDIGTGVPMFYTGVGAVEAIAKGTAWNAGKMTAEAVRKQLRRRGAAGAGDEIHHSFGLNGIGRTEENWRNHPAFLKVLPKADHRRLTGTWGDLPRYGPLQRFWVGTPDWMKAVSSWLLVHGAEALSDLSRDSHGQHPPGTSQPMGQTF